MTQQTNTTSVGGNSNHNLNIEIGGRHFDGHRDCINNTSITKSLLEGKLRDEGRLYKLTITEGSH